MTTLDFENFGSHVGCHGRNLIILPSVFPFDVLKTITYGTKQYDKMCVVSRLLETASIFDNSGGRLNIFIQSQSECSYSRPNLHVCTQEAPTLKNVKLKIIMIASGL